MSKIPDINLPVWMNKGEPLTLAHASKVWWERVYTWLTFPLAQIDVDTCDEQLLTLLAYQRDIDRFPGESLALFRLRVKYAFVNAKDAGSKAGFARIFERLEIGQIQQLERQLWLDWDVILLRINDEQLSRNNALMMNLVRQYGRTCRRYFFDVLTQQSLSVRAGRFDLDAGYHDALYVPTFEIVRFHVNGWMTSEFDPKTSFSGATYSIEAQGAAGDVAWAVIGTASVVPMGNYCAVVIFGPGPVTVTGTDSRGRTVTHAINPVLWFVLDGTKGLIRTVEQWAITMWGRVPLISELTYGTPMSGKNTQRGNLGALWSEWGDMAVYGWPGAPAPGTTWADWWITLSPDINNPLSVWMPVLAGKHDRVEDYSSNGTVTPVNTSNANEFRRVAVWDTTTPFALKGYGVNGWFYTDFIPTTSFAGAKYRLYVVGHGGKPITWKVTGPATITADGWVTITGPGAVSITGKSYRGETIAHAISPKKYLIPSPERIVAAQFPAFLASTGGTHARNVDLTIGRDSRGIGALWNEWGDMNAYGWPVYRAPNVANYWNAKPSETSFYNTVFLNNGNSYNLAASADFLFCIAAVINIEG
ncbi:phage tail protein [Serratia fonticola]|uniref:phage tail protein n=1 Tax=Serratia fonticola TaxID=47917 RepID=UPI001FD7ED5F|nr:phage tail protein [Serratia fonticola]